MTRADAINPEGPIDAAKFADVVNRIHRDQHGRAPGPITTTIGSDLIVALVSDTFGPNELELCRSEEGRKAVQSARRELRALTRRDVERRVGTALGLTIERSFYDIDVRIGQQIEVFVLAS